MGRNDGGCHQYRVTFVLPRRMTWFESTATRSGHNSEGRRDV
jgi:hypothetical protein